MKSKRKRMQNSWIEMYRSQLTATGTSDFLLAARTSDGRQESVAEESSREDLGAKTVAHTAAWYKRQRMKDAAADADDGDDDDLDDNC